MQCVLLLGIFDTTAKLEAAISHIENKQCKGNGEIIRKHLSKELDIFEATGESTKNVKMLFNSLDIIPRTSIELERTKHDRTIAVLIIFVS